MSSPIISVSPAEAVAVVMLLVLVIYTLFGGAD